MEEIWKTCTNYDMYEVSNLGKIRNKNTKRILKQAIRGGYSTLSLTNNSCKRVSLGAHRLVAIEFIPNPENKPQVNHINKNRSDNCVSNLEWTTAKENNIHRSTGVTQTTNQNIKVWRIDKNTDEKLEMYDSLEEAGEWLVQNNYSINLHNAKTTISDVTKGKQNTFGNFKWERVEQPHLENEEWKNVIIEGCEYDKYQISNMGRFKNYKGIIMENYKPHHSGYIYLRVDREKYSLHRLVAFAFLENIDNKPFVNHIDGNKTNNCANNLEWCTVSENNQHAIDTGLKKFYKRKIGQYTTNDELVKEFGSIIEAINETNVKTIKQVLYKKQTTAGGFIWKYLDEKDEN